MGESRSDLNNRAAIARRHVSESGHRSANDAQVRDVRDGANSSAVISWAGERTESIALLIQTSIGPRVSSMIRAADSTSPVLETSTGRMTASPPAASTSSRRVNARGAFAQVIRYERHFVPNSRTVARPTPADAPVITTTSIFN